MTNDTDDPFDFEYTSMHDFRLHMISFATQQDVINESTVELIHDAVITEDDEENQ